jgi:chorismate dehydratase
METAMIDIAREISMECGIAHIRVGAVSYLNSKPLIEGLEDMLRVCTETEGISGELVLDYPSRLADQLARGELDVALIPSVEAFSNLDYEIVSDACVATHGPVMSVKLFSRVPLGEIRSVALDEGSRTSAALVKVMLEERFGVRPALQKFPFESEVSESTADAVLLIGDRAMHEPAEHFVAVWDLGAEWLAWTGLPFVFAMWVTRRGTDLGPVERLLSQSRDLGLRRLQEIACREAAGLRLTEDVAHRYLRDNLYFHLGSAEKNGLRVFHELAQGIGLVPETSRLAFRVPVRPNAPPAFVSGG